MFTVALRKRGTLDQASTVWYSTAEDSGIAEQLSKSRSGERFSFRNPGGWFDEKRKDADGEKMLETVGGKLF